MRNQQCGTVTVEDARQLAASHWFGYGRWNAPFWFVGMEPGGEDERTWYETWVRLGGEELCDCRLHHLGSGFTKWHDAKHPKTQRTWVRLIQLLLGFLNRPSDLATSCNYQRDHWGALSGETALLEISAIRAKNLGTNVARETHREQRIKLLAERLEQYRPEFVLFYGTKYRKIYEQVAGAPFDTHGFSCRGDTLCVLVPHPVGRNNPREMRSEAWWSAKGREMRLRVLAARTSSVDLPSFHLPTSLPHGTGPTAQFKRIARKSSTMPDFDIQPTDVIRILVDSNPKQLTSKSRSRFNCYVDGLTVADYEIAIRQRFGDAEARKVRADIQWDCARNFINLERDGQRIDLSIPPSMQRA